MQRFRIESEYQTFEFNTFDAIEPVVLNKRDKDGNPFKMVRKRWKIVIMIPIYMASDNTQLITEASFFAGGKKPTKIFKLFSPC